MAAKRKTEPPVKVIFKVFKGELLAIFPELPGTNDPSTCEIYARVGQHASADCRTVLSGRPARPIEYASLKRELTRPGPGQYKLRVASRSSSTDYKKRKAEINRVLGGS